MIITGCATRYDFDVVVSNLDFEVANWEMVTLPYTPDYTGYAAVIHNGDHEYLGRLNHVTNTIDLNSLSSDEVMRYPEIPMDESFIPYRRDPKIKGFYTAGSEIQTINQFLIGENQIFSFSGEYKGFVHLSDTVVRTIIHSYNPIVKVGNQVFMTLDPMLDLNEALSEKYLEWELSVDLEASQIKSYSIPLPDIYLNKKTCPSQLIPSRTVDDQGNFLYSYPLSDSMLIVSKDRSETKWALAGGLIVDSSTSEVINNQECWESYQSSSMYEAVLWDSYRHLIYRVYSYPNPDGADKQFGLLVFNDTFDLMAQIDFGDSYDPEFFVGSEGFYIKKKDSTKNSLSYTLLKFEEI